MEQLMNNALTSSRLSAITLATKEIGWVLQKYYALCNIFQNPIDQLKQKKQGIEEFHSIPTLTFRLMGFPAKNTKKKKKKKKIQISNRLTNVTQFYQSLER